MGRKLKANNVLSIYLQSHFICLQIHANYVTFLFEKRFLRKECKEHSIVCISTLMIINIIVLELTMRANESCFDEFEFCKTLTEVLKVN